VKPQLDLNSRYLKVLLGLISVHLSDSIVWAYGSRVKNQNHDTSDLDIVVISKCYEFSDILSFREVLRESNIPVLIDVMDWNVIPESFKDEINQCHVQIYPSENV